MRIQRPTTLATAVVIPFFGVLAACGASGQLEKEMDTRAEATPSLQASVAAATKPTQRPTAQPLPTLRPVPSRTPMAGDSTQSSSLSHIALGTDRPDVNMKTYDQATGVDALEGLVPEGALESAAGALAEATRFSFAGPLDAANPRGSYAHFVTFAFRYTTPQEARAIHSLIVEALAAGGEWEPTDLGGTLGETAWAAVRDGNDGQDIGFVWQRSNLVLAILGLDDSDRAVVRDTARRMDERAS